MVALLQATELPPTGRRWPWAVLFGLLLSLALVPGTWLGPWNFRATDGEQIPGDTEVLSDRAIRVNDPNDVHTKATLDLPDGGLLEFRYCTIADSGVHLRRYDRQGGCVLWERECARLGVLHSEYEHQVVIQIEGQTAKVTSRGSSGTFVERLDLASGRSLARSVRKAAQDESFVERVRGWLGLN
jgi:hypothetical protein